MEKGTKEIKKDAKGQFVRSKHGRHNDGVLSAKPRVITGTDDATFKTDPKAPDRKDQEGASEKH